MGRKKTKDEPDDQKRSRAKKNSVTIAENAKLEYFFAAASSDYVCCVCGETVKNGKRKTHDSSCRLPSDDEDVIFVEETKDRKEEDTTPDYTKIRRRKKRRICVEESSCDETENDAPPSSNCKDDTPSISDWKNDNPANSDRCKEACHPAPDWKKEAAGTAAVSTNDALRDCSQPILDDEDLFQVPNPKPENGTVRASSNVASAVASARTIPAAPSAKFGHSQLEESTAESINSSANGAASSDSDDNEVTEVPDGAVETITPFLLVAIKEDIIERVYNDVFHSHLFDDNDGKMIESFLGLPGGAQTLFCRLFTRKRSWISLNSLKKRYGSALNVEGSIEALRKAHFVDSVDQMNNLHEALASLSLTQLQTLSKVQFRLTAVSTKKQIIEELLTHSSRQTSLKGTMEASIIKKAKAQIGACFRTSERAYLLLLCMLHVFNPDIMSSSNLADGRYKSIPDLINNLVNVLRQKHRELISFASSTGIRQIHQFRSREHLHLYVEMNILEAKMRHFLTNGRFRECEEINADSLQRLKGLLEDGGEEYKQVVSHFRKYTAPWVLFRIIGLGVDVLEKQKKYVDAVQQLREMIEISDGFWCPAARSRWYERLALDLDAHLKKPEQALETIESAWTDNHLAEDTRQTLYDRAEKIVKSLSSEARTRLAKSVLSRRLKALKRTAEEVEIPQLTINGELLNKTLGGRQKTIFATIDYQDGTGIIRNVEEVAKEYYIRNQGFTEGIHGEGSPWLCLFGLFFWDIINDPNVPDAFVCSQQWMPLDLNDPEFYSRRRARVDEKLQWLTNSSSEDRLHALHQCWTANRGKEFQLINWDLFSDLDQIKRFVSCMSGTILAKVFQRLVSKFRYTRSGFPDLLLWNYEEMVFKVVEVKGPGDRLSMRQRIWLQFFITIGMDAEICWVKGVSGKRFGKERYAIQLE